MKLFVDSSTTYLYINIIDNNNVISFVRLSKNDHSELLVSSLETFLKNQNYSINDVTKIFIGRGPGSYTGVRISGTFGKTLSFIKKLPFYSFSSLDYLLSDYLETDGKYIVAVPAKKNHSYVKAITVQNNIIKVDLEECFVNNELLSDYQEYTLIEPTEKLIDPNNLLKYNMYQEEDNLEYTPNYLRSEFN